MLMVGGSHMYGTNVATSDEDVRGVCFAPRSTLLGFGDFTVYRPKTGGDIEVHSLNKFAKLCLAGNPNVSEFLFTSADKNKYYYHTDVWSRLLSLKHHFLCKRYAFSYLGYAEGQFNDFKRHAKWIDSPPLSGTRESEHYTVWRREVNPARYALIEKYRMDTKAALHMVRTVQQGIELMNTGNIVFPRPNTEELKQILHGKMLYADLIDWYNIYTAQLRQLADTADLPDVANTAVVEQFVIDANAEYVAAMRKTGE